MAGPAQGIFGSRSVKVGVIDAWEAPLNTALREGATTAINLKWLPLGVIEPGSFKLDPKAEYFQFKSGVPETIKKTYVVGFAGEANLTLREFTAYGVRTANGGKEPTLTANNDGALALHATAAGTKDQIIFAADQSTKVKAGDELIVDLTTTTLDIGWGAGKAVVYASKVTGATVDVIPSLPDTPKNGGTASVVGTWKLDHGTTTVREKSYLFVFTDTDGHQGVIHVHKAQATGGYSPNFADGKKEITIPLKLDIYGVDLNNDNQPIIATSYLFKDRTAGATAATGKPLYGTISES